MNPFDEMGGDAFNDAGAALDEQIERRMEADRVASGGYAPPSFNAVQLRRYELWERVADEIGDHDYGYDLNDSSHRLDIVQVICEALARVVDRGR